MTSSTGQTSTGSKSLVLPEIRTMSPFTPVPVSDHHAADSAITASSFASHDSFMTAFTSTPSPSPSSPSYSRLTVSTPHSLRKSVSVDSFINARRSPDMSEAGPSSNGQTREYTRDGLPGEQRMTGNTGDISYSSVQPSTNGRYSPPPASKSLTSRILGRTRGHSLSGPSASDYDDPYLDDSEHERTSDIAQLPMLSFSRNVHSSSLNGFKGKARSRPDDALLLPPRASSLSTASSVSSLSSFSTTAAPLVVPPVPPLPQTRSTRRPVPGALIVPHRSRSGSLGTNPTRTSVDSSAPHSEMTAFTIGVVGAPECGKTTLIRKGLKAWSVGEETIRDAVTPYGRLRYGIRKINAARDDDVNAHVIEIDSHLLQLDTPDGALPEGLPAIDGILVLYDASDPSSFERVPDLMACYHKLQMPTIVIACKSDLEKKIAPHRVSERTSSFNMGLVEVTSLTERGKHKMRQCFHFLIRSIEKAQRGDIPTGTAYHNPASPDLLNAPWSETLTSESRNVVRSRVGTPSASSPSTVTRFPQHRTSPSPTGASTPTPRSPSLPTSPTRVKSTNDLMSEVERNRQEERDRQLENSEGRSGSLPRSTSLSRLQDGQPAENGDYAERGPSGESKDMGPRKNNDPPPMPWATLDELLDKLFFLAASGDDPTFIRHFFLTYRKFATPRTVLLGMQKRIRQLSQEHADLLLGNYAQMRICDLLEEWIRAFPSDFATPGAYGAITALAKQISSNPSTLHYGSDILPFLEILPTLQDADASWALPCEDTPGDSEDEGLDDEEEEGVTSPTTPIITNMPNDSDTVVNSSIRDSITASVQSQPKTNGTRERKGSLPLSSKSMLTTTTSTSSSEGPRPYPKHIPTGPRTGNSVKELVKLAQNLATYDTLEIAQQITRMQSELFLKIEPRQWLRYAMGDAKSDPDDPISACAALYNHLAYWVSSLIVAHDRVKTREKQVERFVELAKALRTMNNYVGLRAVMTGINNATFPSDEIMTMFRDNKIRLYQQYLGLGVLINSQNNHRSYRLALRHTSGPAVPDMEVHTFDIVRAHDSNPNYKPDDPSKIHWGKFTLMGRMITTLQSLQDKIRSSANGYDYPEKRWIRDTLQNEVMDIETIQSRVFSPPDDAEALFPLSHSQGPESPSATRSEAAKFRRLFFW